MSVFSENITNEDDIIRSGYDVVWHQEHKCYFLRTKRDKDDRSVQSWVYEKNFVPVEMLWNYYMSEGACNRVHDIFGWDVAPNQEDFINYVQRYRYINKLTYKGISYFDRSYLWEMFEHYNEHVAEEYLKNSFNNR